jgi:type I restriction enzyme S subunit
MLREGRPSRRGLPVAVRWFENLLVFLPPIAQQIQIVILLDREKARIDVLVAKIREAIERLWELRTALISAAVTGMIDVRAA